MRNTIEAIVDLLWTFFPVLIVAAVLALISRIDAVWHRADVLLCSAVVFAEGAARARKSFRRLRNIQQALGILGAGLATTAATVAILEEAKVLVLELPVLSTRTFQFTQSGLLIMSVVYGIHVRRNVWERQALNYDTTYVKSSQDSLAKARDQQTINEFAVSVQEAWPESVIALQRSAVSLAKNTETVSLNPGDADAKLAFAKDWREMGQAQRDLGDLDAALASMRASAAAFADVCRMRPHDASVRLEFAHGLQDVATIAERTADLARATRYYVSSVRALNQLASEGKLPFMDLHRAAQLALRVATKKSLKISGQERQQILVSWVSELNRKSNEPWSEQATDDLRRKYKAAMLETRTPL